MCISQALCVKQLTSCGVTVTSITGTLFQVIHSPMGKTDKIAKNTKTCSRHTYRIVVWGQECCAKKRTGQIYLEGQKIIQKGDI